MHVDVELRVAGQPALERIEGIAEVSRTSTEDTPERLKALCAVSRSAHSSRVVRIAGLEDADHGPVGAAEVQASCRPPGRRTACMAPSPTISSRRPGLELPAFDDLQFRSQREALRLDAAQRDVGAAGLALARHFGDHDQLARGQRQAVVGAGDGRVLLDQRRRSAVEEAGQFGVRAAAQDDRAVRIAGGGERLARARPTSTASPPARRPRRRCRSRSPTRRPAAAECCAGSSARFRGSGCRVLMAQRPASASTILQPHRAQRRRQADRGGQHDHGDAGEDPDARRRRGSGTPAATTSGGMIVASAMPTSAPITHSSQRLGQHQAQHGAVGEAQASSAPPVPECARARPGSWCCRSGSGW